MKTWAYLRVSTDYQDLEAQRYLLLDYAQKNQLLIEEFVQVKISAKRSWVERRLQLLLEQMQSGDTLLVAELSRLGRNMVETLQLIERINQMGVKLIFVRQPELSTAGPQAPLLLAIYSYFAQAEREYISLRTKEGLAALKARGQVLGRPKGSRNKALRERQLLLPQIQRYRALGLNFKAILILINQDREVALTYEQLRYLLRQTPPNS